MKIIATLFLYTLLLASPLAPAHPHHDDEEGPNIKNLRVPPHAPVEKPYGRPGNAAEVTRTVNLDLPETMKLTPNELAVKQDETIKFAIRNSGKAAQRVALGTQDELKDSIAMLKKFPKMEMKQANQVEVKPGETAVLVWKFTQAGNFNFACLATACLQAGAMGKIVVNGR